MLGDSDSIPGRSKKFSRNFSSAVYQEYLLQENLSKLPFETGIKLYVCVQPACARACVRELGPVSILGCYVIGMKWNQIIDAKQAWIFENIWHMQSENWSFVV